MRVLFATAELAPLVKVGGLADFSAGLVGALRSQGIHVDVVLPDYGGLPIEPTEEHQLSVPEWAGPATVRQGTLEGFDVSLVTLPEMARPNPYLDGDGRAWPDNDRRFLAFSTAIAAWAETTSPDVLHLNDWHTGATLGLADSPPPSVLTIHNLAYQGTTTDDWLKSFKRRPDAYHWNGSVNPLAGAIALANRVVTVSPRFATESLQPETSFGLSVPLRARGDAFSGILNGIDTDVWDPATDPHLGLHYDMNTTGRKRELGRLLVEELGWEANSEPLIGMVTRLTDQKGVDIALETVSVLEDMGARMVLLGSGERALADAARQTEGRFGDRFVFKDGYDEALAHRIFGGSDLYLMPSRFEPSGLTQMQAMRYGTIPVVTNVGGLHDTVIDAGDFPDEGTGFVAAEVTVPALVDALARAVRAVGSSRSREAISRQGMSRDWSWQAPASLYSDLYAEISSAR